MLFHVLSRSGLSSAVLSPHLPLLLTPSSTPALLLHTLPLPFRPCCSTHSSSSTPALLLHTHFLFHSGPVAPHTLPLPLRPCCSTHSLFHSGPVAPHTLPLPLRPCCSTHTSSSTPALLLHTLSLFHSGPAAPHTLSLFPPPSRPRAICCARSANGCSG